MSRQRKPAEKTGNQTLVGSGVAAVGLGSSYLDMEFGTRMPLYCGAPVPNQPSPYAEPYLFKTNLLLVRLYLHSRTEERRHTTNHLFHTA